MAVDLGALSKDLNRVVDVFAAYDSALDDVEGIIKMQGKTVNEALAENASWLLYYDQRKVELKKLTRFMEDRVKRVRGKLYKAMTNNNHRDLSDRAKDKYIDQEKAYLDVRSVQYEVQELFEKYESVVETFRARGFALNNIVKAKVAELDGIII
jgi:hypothetical protein